MNRNSNAYRYKWPNEIGGKRDEAFTYSQIFKYTDFMFQESGMLSRDTTQNQNRIIEMQKCYNKVILYHIIYDRCI